MMEAEVRAAALAFLLKRRAQTTDYVCDYALAIS
jgi:hypothetical protein